MKKLLFGLFLLVTTIFLAACQNGELALTQFVFDSDEKVISFSALASTALIPEENIIQPMSVGEINTLSTEETGDEVIDVITPYLDMVEKFLGDNQGLSVTTEVSDRVEYAEMMVFQTVDMLGNPTTYKIYYTMTEVVEDDEDEDELTYEMTGLLLYAGNEYEIFGKKEVEDNEEKITFKAYVDELTYVESTYKIEDNEYKFVFKTYQNGELTSESKIKVETDLFEVKIDLEYIEGDNLGEYEFKFEEEDGQTVLKIEFDQVIDGIFSEGEVKVLVVVDEITGETTYELIVRGKDSDEERHYEKERDDDDNDPTEPTEPSEPTDPSEPTEPSEPTDSSEPSEPTETEDETIETEDETIVDENNTYENPDGDLNSGATTNE
jgi:hypothetical protein